MAQIQSRKSIQSRIQLIRKSFRSRFATKMPGQKFGAYPTELTFTMDNRINPAAAASRAPEELYTKALTDDVVATRPQAR